MYENVCDLTVDLLMDCTHTTKIEIIHNYILFKKTLNRFNSLKQLNYLYISIVSSKDCNNFIKLPKRI